MKLLFKQRFFSLFVSYDIYDEEGNVVFVVKGKFSWGHCLRIYDANGNDLGEVVERVMTFLPKFDLYLGTERVGCISKELTFLKPKYEIDCNGWKISGDWLEWDYTITDEDGEAVATVTKEVWNLTDTYVIDVKRQEDALCTLMVVLAIDAEKCSRD